MEWIAALIGAGANLLGGWLGSNAAQQASSTEAQASDKAINLQSATIAQARADAAPWLDAGKKGLDALMGELGLQTKNSDGSQFESKFTKQPGYDFMQSEGNKGAVNNLKALGMGASGAALKALSRFNSGLANNTYQQYLDRLSGVSTGGQSTGATSASQQIAGSQGIGQSIMDGGAARASGYVGAANSWINALGNTANSTGKALGASGNNWNFLGA
jgi:hypothetical protein